MTIIFVNGPPRSGKTTVARSLKRGALLDHKTVLVIDGKNTDRDGNEEPRKDHAYDSPAWLVQRLLVGNPFPGSGRDGEAGFDPGGLKDGTVYDVETLPWKPNVLIIVVEKAGEDMLRGMGQVVPGLRRRFAPEYSITTAVGGPK